MSYNPFPTDPPPIFPFLPPIGFPVHKKPFFTAWEHRSITGAQFQTARQVYPNWDFELQMGEESWLREETQNNPIYLPNFPYKEFMQMSQLFLACFGSFGDFWYKDPEDNSRLGQVIGVGDNVAIKFRIVRTWGFVPLARLEPVGGVDLVSSVPTVYLNGTAQSPLGYNVTNDLDGSHVTFNVAPTAGVVITMDFNFFFRCRWKDDFQQYDQWAKNLWQYGKCEFRSVKP